MMEDSIILLCCTVGCLLICLSLLFQFLIRLIPERNLYKRYQKNFKISTTKPTSVSWAFITGGSSGIGKALSLKLARQGFNVAILGSTRSHLENTEKEIHSKYPFVEIKLIQADLSRVDVDPNPQEPAKYSNLRVVNEILRQLKGLDIAVIALNAGVGLLSENNNPTPFALNMLHANIVTHTHLFIELFPSLTQREVDNRKKRGCVFFTSSLMSTLPMVSCSMYNGTKAFITAFAESLACESRMHRVDVVVVRPGYVHSEFLRRMPTIKAMRVVGWFGQTPSSVASLLLRAVGRVSVLDSGLQSILGRCFFRFIDLNLYIPVVSIFAPIIMKLRKFIRKKFGSSNQ